MSLLLMSLADQSTVTEAAPRSARRAARELRTIVSGTLTAGGVAAAAGVQWAARRAATVARRRLEALGRASDPIDDVEALADRAAPDAPGITA